MALQPEFISTLRVIRDVYYPEITIMHQEVSENLLVITSHKDEVQTMYEDAIVRSEEWRNIDVDTTTTLGVNPDGSSVNATAMFNYQTGYFDFGIPVGANGIVGPQGTKGTTGDDGPEGSQGAKGAQGVAGIGMTILGSDSVANILIKSPDNAGDSWLSLDNGYDDDGIPVTVDDVLNATGDKWINVGKIKGIDGEEGPTGSTGARGPQGLDGPQGSQGPAGPNGAKGDKGTRGDKGETGDKGEDATLPNNVAYRDINNRFTTTQTFSGTVDAQEHMVLAKMMRIDGEFVSYKSGFKNIIMNPRFWINQRGISNQDAPLYAYGADRWIKGTADIIHQRIEWGQYKPNVVYTYSENGIKIKEMLSPASGTWQINTSIACAYCQLEEGTVFTDQEFRPIQVELAMCQRYYWRYNPIDMHFHCGATTGVELHNAIQFPVTMRQTPVILKHFAGANLYGCYEPAVDGANADRADIWTVGNAVTNNAYVKFNASHIVEFVAEVV